MDATSSAFALLTAACLCAGCGEASTQPGVGGHAVAGGGGEPAASSGGGGSAAGVHSGGAGAAGGTAGSGAVVADPLCVTRDEPTYQPYSNEPPQVPLCEDPDTLPLPAAGKLLDLTDLGPGSAGTCGTFAQGDDDAMVIDVPAADFPQIVRLPAIGAADPGCADVCVFGLRPTAFGLALSYPALAGEDRILTVRVPAPWYLVIGNEHSPTPCLDGSPSTLEYGKPLACATTWGYEIGFATADPNAPSVDVILDLVEPDSLPNTPICCPYTCPARE